MIRQPERKPPLYLVTGLVFGLFLGFVLAWIIWPAHVSTVGPDSLANSYKDQYRLEVSLAYASTRDLGRAEARLALLGDSDAVRALTTQAQEALASESTQREARALGGLAQDLGVHLKSQQSTAAAVNTPNPGEQPATPFESGTGAAYVLDNQQLTCGDPQGQPSIQIYTSDANNLPQAGIELTLSSGEDKINLTTGQQPSQGPGYAGTAIQPQSVYTLFIQGVETMGGIQASACETADGEPAWGSWVLLFRAEK